MKIVCDSCGTKYSIADEKVKGKVFKIRCKKCSHIIVVKGTGEAAAGEAPKAASFDQKETRVFDYSGFDGAKGDAGAAPPTEGAPPPSDADAGAGEAVWHLVVDREQIGPMTVAEVQERFQRNEIDADTYGWREGFADWQKLSAIPDFDAFSGGAANGHAAAAPEATGKSDAGDLFASAGAAADKEDEAGDLFGGGAAPSLFGGAAASAPAAAEAPRAASKKRGGDDDLFASAGASGGGDLFGDAGGAAVSARSEPAPASQGLKGARNENSVLFSLNNLAALASGAPKASSSPSSSSSPSAQPSGFMGSSTSTTEGSGLIDIRAMAATTMGVGLPKLASASSAPVDDLPVLSPSTFSASPVLVPVSSSSGTPKWLMPAMIGLGVLLVGVAVVLVIMLTRKPAKPQPALAANTPGAGASPGPGVAAGGPTDPQPSASPTASADPGTGTPPVDPGSTTGTVSVPSPGAEVKPSPGTKPHDKGDKTPPKGDKTPVKGDKTPTPSKEPTPPKDDKPPKETGGDVEIKCMINPDLAICKKGGSKTPDKPDKPDKPVTGDLPARLSKPDIQAGISPIKGSATACFGKYNVPGTVNVKVTIGGNGKVQSASASGSFSGTPTGTCVENAVKKASFKKFSDDSMSFTYPFVLR